LGRSGTGKTTATIIRMFTQEILYISLLKQKKFNQKVELELAVRHKTRLESSDLAYDTGLRYVFVTASPVLTNEVRRFYNSLKEQLINHLKAKEINRLKKVEGSSDDEFTIVETT
jgi:predicted RNA polymerase sigma factor